MRGGSSPPFPTNGTIPKASHFGEQIILALMKPS